MPRSVSHFHPVYFQSLNKRKMIIKLWYPTYYELLCEIAPHPYILQKQVDPLNDFLSQTSGFKLSIWLMINYTLFLGHIWRILVYSVLFMFLSSTLTEWTNFLTLSIYFMYICYYNVPIINLNEGDLFDWDKIYESNYS